MAKSFDFIIKH